MPNNQLGFDPLEMMSLLERLGPLPAPGMRVAPAPAPVPGQLAQAIVPATTSPVPMNANQRIEQVFADAAKPPPIPRAAPAPQQAPVPQQAPTPAATATHDGSGQDQGFLSKMLGLSPEVSGRIQDALASGAAVNPRAGKFGAFAQGAAGSRISRNARQDRKRAEVLARAESDREGRKEGRDIDKNRREEDKAEREGRKAKYDRLKTAADIRKTIADTRKAEREAKKTGLKAYEVIRIAEASNKFRQAEIANRGGEYNMEAEDAAEVDEATKEFRADLTRRAQEAAARSGGQEPGQAAGQTAGAGTSESPFEQQGGDPMAWYDALPSGAIFRNPKDGTILQKP